MFKPTLILMLCSKSMHRWNPLCKGFILSHFGRACCMGQHCVLIHTIVRKSLVKYCKRPPKGTPRWERVKAVISLARIPNTDTQIHKRRFSISAKEKKVRTEEKPSYVYLFCSKSDFFMDFLWGGMVLIGRFTTNW